MSAEPLSLFVLYEHPRDFPAQWVLRRWEVAAELRATPDVWVDDSPDLLRELCSAHGLVCMPRHDDDDPAISEVWF